MLFHLFPELTRNGFYFVLFVDASKTGVKISKAALLQKGGDCLKDLKLKLEGGEREISSCKQAISILRSQLEMMHNR